MKKLLALITVIAFLTCLSAVADEPTDATSQQVDKAGEISQGQNNEIVYVPPAGESLEKRRRIGGTAVSAHRGLTRGLGKSLSRELAKGLVKKKSPARGKMLVKKKPPARGKMLVKSAPQKTIPRNKPDYLSPIAPESIGLTVNVQPVVYLYISSAWPDELTFKLSKEGVAEPVLKSAIDGPIQAGIVQIDLKEYTVELEQDVEYEWFASILPNPKDPSSKIFCSAVIKYVEPSASLTQQLHTTPDQQKCSVYAKEGYFYDAVEHLTGLIQTDGDGLKAQRAALCEQVKLSFVAKYDRQAP